ncbi:MAG: hypothetical protein ACREVV_08380, partial [Steroidobacteraceae bacterium]
AAQGCSGPPGFRWTIETGDGSGALGIAAICNDLGRIVFAHMGPYRIRVYGVDASTGDYRIDWLASRPDKRLSLRPEVGANGRIDLPGAADVYDFDATAGTVAYFAAAQGCSGPPGFRWTIETGDGSGALGIAAICNDLGRIVFAHTGPYRIRVYGVDASTGDYRIQWLASRPDKRLSLRPGTAANGRIDLPGAADVYDFDAAAGTVGYFAAAQGCSGPPGFRWTIETGDGSGTLGMAAICNDLGRIVFAHTGPYRIRVYGVDASIGAYQISWK